MRMPLHRELRPRTFPRQAKALAGPFLVAFVQQRQIEQPFSGIIDDIECQSSLRAIPTLVVDREPQLADVGRRVWPAALLDQGANVVLVVETRYRVVGLRLKPRPRDPSGRKRLENGKSAATNEAMDQGGDKDGLAGARQAGDAEPDAGVEK